MEWIVPVCLSCLKVGPFLCFILLICSDTAVEHSLLQSIFCTDSFKGELGTIHGIRDFFVRIEMRSRDLFIHYQCISLHDNNRETALRKDDELLAILYQLCHRTHYLRHSFDKS